MQLITIKESHYTSELTVLKSRLESEGIKCFIDGELTSQVFNHIPSMQAKLKVFNTDLERVKEIMVENGEWTAENKKIGCPKCGSEKLKLKLSFQKKIKFAISIFIALVTYVPVDELYRNAKYKCKKCEFEFSGNT